MADIKKYGINVDEMAKAGMQFGHRTSKTYPTMKEYVASTRNGIHLFDLEKSAQKLAEALDFVKKMADEGKTILLVGTKVQTRLISKAFGKEAGIFYISVRWLGGTFTNFETMKKRLTYFKTLEKKKETGELEKYTKKERANFDKELFHLENKFGGIKNMEKLPDLVFVLDMKKDYLAIKEANEKRIPVVAIADMDINPSVANYIIPANDDAVSSVKYILERLKEALKK